MGEIVGLVFEVEPKEEQQQTEPRKRKKKSEQGEE